MNKYLIRVIIILFGGYAAAASAVDCDIDPDACAEIGKWQISLALGIGVRTNPVLNNDDIPLIVLPQINYNGERLFIQNLDLGFIVFEDDRRQFNILVTPSYDQVFFNRWDARNFVIEDVRLSADTGFVGPAIESKNEQIDTDELRKRRMAGLAGFEYNNTLDGFDLQFQVLQEFTGLHHGQEVRLAVTKNYHIDKHNLALSMGAIWQSGEVLDYYYGLKEGEAGLSDYRYKPGGDTSGVIRFDWGYELTKNWSLRLTTAYRQLASEIRNSPIVDDDKVITVFAGGVYHF